jgi:hypothetical protein
MIEAYAVGVSLKMHNFVSSELQAMIPLFEELDKLTASLQGNLAALGLEKNGLKGLDTQAKNLTKHMGEAAVSTEALERRLQAIKALGMNGGLPTPGVIPVPGGGGKGGKSSHGSGVHGQMHMGASGAGMSTGMALGDLAVPAMVAAGAVYTGHSLYEASKDYQSAFARFQTLNLGQKINEDADAFAKGTKQFGVSMQDRMTVLRDLHEIMGNYHEAKELTPLFTEMMFANKAVYGEEGSKFDRRQEQMLGKAIEMKGGAKSPEAARRQANYAQKAFSGAAGMLSPDDFLEFIKKSGTTGQLLSDEAFWYQSAPMIQEMGGSTYGTGIMSMQQNLGMGRASVQAVKEAMRLDLLDPKMVEFTKIGTVKRALPGALKTMDLFDKSKYEWLMQVLIPAIRAKGVYTAGHKLVKGDAINDDMIVDELNYLFSQRTASKVAAQMYIQRSKIDKNIEVSKKAMDIDQLDALAKKTASGAEEDFMAAWKDCKKVMGDTFLPQMTEFLKGTSAFLRRVGDMLAWIRSDKDIMGISPEELKRKVPVIDPFTGREIVPEAPSIFKGFLSKGHGLSDDFAFSGASHDDKKPIVLMTDGRVMAQTVTDHQAKAANSIASGTSRFDGSMTATPSTAMSY